MRASALSFVVLVVVGAFLFPRHEAPLAAVPVKDQRVVYVSPDYSVLTMLADGKGRDRITSGASSGGVLAQPLLQEDTHFTWPVWSPDGRRLVVSRFSGLDQNQVAALSLIEPPSREERVLQISRHGLVDRVAEGTFHFPLWSPDGELLALIAPNDGGTALQLSVTDLDRRTVGVATGAPLYFTWSPDSTLIAIHHRERLLFRDSEGELFDTGRPSIRYRVPAISGDSETLAYVADLGDGERLVTRKIATAEERDFTLVPTEAAFAFSPASHDTLAIAIRSTERSAVYGGLTLIDVALGKERIVYDDTVFGFWWSPDGTKIALVGTNSDSFTLVVVDVATGEVSNLASFIPSPEFTTYIQFFDQFGLSQDIWSADSTAITITGLMVVDGERTLTDKAWVVDVTGERQPVSLAEAVLAFFVPAEPRPK